MQQFLRLCWIRYLKIRRKRKKQEKGFKLKIKPPITKRRFFYMFSNESIATSIIAVP